MKGQCQQKFSKDSQFPSGCVRPHLHCMVQVTQFRFYPPMWHRSDMAHDRVSRKKIAWIPMFSDQFKASFICGNKSDMNRILAFALAV